MTIMELFSKWAQGINEQLLKTSGADILSSRNKLRKTAVNPYVKGNE